MENTNTENLPITVDSLLTTYSDFIERVEDYSDPKLKVNRIRIFFKNELELSIIQGPFTFGGSKGLFELAVLYKDEFVEDWFNDSVLGYQSTQQVSEWIRKIGMCAYEK